MTDVCDCTGPFTQTCHVNNPEGHQVDCPRWGAGPDRQTMFDIPYPEPDPDEEYR